MDFTLSEEQEELRALARRIFAERATAERVKQVESGRERFDRELWSDLAGAALTGLAVPEADGGSGLGLLEVATVLEEQGRRVAPVPYGPTVLVAMAIAELGEPAQRARWLPGVASGEVVLTAALSEGAGTQPAVPRSRARPSGAGWILSGTKVCVPYVQSASRVLVPVRGEEGTGLFLVDPAAAELTPVETTSREPEAHMELRDVVVGDEDVLSAPAPSGEATVDAVVERALVSLAALQVGVAEEALALAAAYTSERQQFGRPLATNQGVALRAADAYIDVEAMRSTMWQAAWRLAEGLPASAEVRVAKWWAAEGGHRVVHAAQHLHGGLGADVDYPVHRYFLWGKQIEDTLGGASEQLARLGDILAASVGGR